MRTNCYYILTLNNSLEWWLQILGCTALVTGKGNVSVERGWKRERERSRWLNIYITLGVGTQQRFYSSCCVCVC